MDEQDEISVAAGTAGVWLVDSGIVLDECDSVDLLLLQWRTEVPRDRNGVWQPPNQLEIARKRKVLTELTPHLANRPSRPLFLVAPELSLPAELIPDVERLIEASQKPIVVMVGLEHLSQSDFEALSQSFVATPLENPDPSRRVNAAAIWIALNGHTRKFLHSKRWLADPELHQFARGRCTFLFRSSNQQGGRLNFAVAICADFTDDEHVLLLRKDMEMHAQALDLMFVLQMNPDQDAVQFRTAVKSYFKPHTKIVGVSLIETDKSALVFVNNASLDVTASEFGRCATHFHFNATTATTGDGPATYAIEHHGGFDHKSAVFRDNCNSAFWVEYVPLQRANSMRGSGEPQPFRSATSARLDDGGQLLFAEIPPTIHWLLTSWQSALPQLRDQAQQNFTMAPKYRDAAVRALTTAWLESIDWWRIRLGCDENNTRRLLHLFADRITGNEPRLWKAENAVFKLLRSFVLLLAGATRAVSLSIARCAHIDVDGRPIAFLTGGDDRTWYTVASQYYGRNRAQILGVGVEPLLVIDQADGDTPWTAEYVPTEITAEDSGEIYDIRYAPKATLRCAGTSVLYNELCGAVSYDEGVGAIRVRVDAALR